MQKRQSHKKSRRGCRSCKSRHVKCDEQRDTCANCTVRGIECVYENSSRASPSSSSSSAAITRYSSRNSSDQAGTPGIAIKNANSPYPDSLSPTSEFRRFLELDLMRRWCTHTYKSFSCMPADYPFMQVVLPRECMKEKYLLNGLFALTAIDMLMSGDVPVPERGIYRQAALEYFNQGTEMFRKKLDNPTEKNVHFLYMFAVTAADITLLIPEVAEDNLEGVSMLERIKQFFYMLRGALAIARVQESAFWDSPVGLRTVISSLMNASLDYLKPVDGEGMILLQKVNDSFHQTLFTARESSPSELDEAETMYGVYSRVIEYLQFCFAEDGRGEIRGYCISIGAACGDHFDASFNRGEPMAILIILVWAVLVHRLEGEFWWANKLGRATIKELSMMLVDSPLALIPETAELVLWARAQVGLDAGGEISAQDVNIDSQLLLLGLGAQSFEMIDPSLGLGDSSLAH